MQTEVEAGVMIYKARNAKGYQHTMRERPYLEKTWEGVFPSVFIGFFTNAACAAWEAQSLAYQTTICRYVHRTGFQGCQIK